MASTFRRNTSVVGELDIDEYSLDDVVVVVQMEQEFTFVADNSLLAAVFDCVMA